jgi:hypothetical protein
VSSFVITFDNNSPCVPAAVRYIPARAKAGVGPASHLAVAGMCERSPFGPVPEALITSPPRLC